MRHDIHGVGTPSTVGDATLKALGGRGPESFQSTVVEIGNEFVGDVGPVWSHGFDPSWCSFGGDGANGLLLSATRGRERYTVRDTTPETTYWSKKERKIRIILFSFVYFVNSESLQCFGQVVSPPLRLDPNGLRSWVRE